MAIFVTGKLIKNDERGHDYLVSVVVSDSVGGAAYEKPMNF
jgi:hypothetical protein